MEFLQEVTWQDVRLEVHQVNKELANIIDKIDPNKNYKLVKAIYSFGDLIIREGITCLPCYPGKSRPISVCDINEKLKNKLSYSTIPLMLILENTNEVFIDTGSRIIPLNLFYPGSLLGVFESIDFMFQYHSKPKWSVSAGAREIFMLPKITENGGLKRLRIHYRFSSNLNIKKLSDHWHIFTAMANSPAFKQQWQNTILFFTDDWFNNHRHDPGWAEFRDYTFKQGWYQAQFAVSKVELALNWETFVDAISSRNLKPPPYLADQVKHIMAIAAGRWPGFKPADNSQSIAPTKELQEAFVDIYNLKNYLPTIMHTSLLNTENPTPLYYSLYLPTVLEGSPRDNSSSTIMLNLRNMKLLFKTIEQALNKEKFTDGPLKKAIFDYYHVDQDIYNEILPSKLIAEKDSRFLEDKVNFVEREFCASSPFWRGCIKIDKNGE